MSGSAVTLDDQIKRLIVDTLALEGVAPGDIQTEAPLFGEGLGLDSIDALELGVAIHKKFGVTLDPNDPSIRAHFASVASLASYISQFKKAV